MLIEAEIFAVLYSLIFVTQPLNAISPIDQKFFELIIPIATFLTGTLSGIMLAGGDKDAQKQALASANAGWSKPPSPAPTGGFGSGATPTTGFSTGTTAFGSSTSGFGAAPSTSFTPAPSWGTTPTPSSGNSSSGFGAPAAEVVTGFGRLGHWFASEEVFEIIPDMITCAKGLTSGYLPLGACIISDRVLEIASQGDEPSAFTNGYTYSAHPVSCAAALKNIEIFENERILENVRNVSPHFQHRLKDLMKYDIVGDARGMGLLGCIECKAEDLEAERSLGSKIDEACEELGLLVRPLVNMAVFSPPLIITIEQIDEMFDILEAAIIKVENNL